MTPFILVFVPFVLSADAVVPTRTMEGDVVVGRCCLDGKMVIFPSVVEGETSAFAGDGPGTPGRTQLPRDAAPPAPEAGRTPGSPRAPPKDTSPQLLPDQGVTPEPVTPSRTGWQPSRGKTAIDDMFVENAGERLTPAQLEKFKTALDSPDRLNRPLPSGGPGRPRALLQVDDPVTGLVVDLDHMGRIVSFKENAPNLHHRHRAVAPAQVEIQWNPLNGPGPLGIERAATFRASTCIERILDSDTILYRAYSGTAGEFGKYWSREKPTGPYQSAIDGAIKPEWGNTLENVSAIRVPKGTRIYEGDTSSQGGLIGGRNQVVIEYVDPSWRVRE